MNSDPYLTPQSSPPYSTNQLPPITAQVAETADTIQSPEEIENEIAAQVIASFVVSAFGLLFPICLLGLVLGPFAVYRSNRALRLIRAHNVGHRYYNMAMVGIIVGVAVFLFNIVAPPVAFHFFRSL